jgi:hypothetical protein
MLKLPLLQRPLTYQAGAAFRSSSFCPHGARGREAELFVVAERTWRCRYIAMTSAADADSESWTLMQIQI